MMSPELEKRLEEVAQAFGPPEISPHALADAFRPLLREVWSEAIEAAAGVCEGLSDCPHNCYDLARNAEDHVCAEAIRALKEVD